MLFLQGCFLVGRFAESRGVSRRGARNRIALTLTSKLVLPACRSTALWVQQGRQPSVKRIRPRSSIPLAAPPCLKPGIDPGRLPRPGVTRGRVGEWGNAWENNAEQHAYRDLAPWPPNRSMCQPGPAAIAGAETYRRVSLRYASRLGACARALTIETGRAPIACHRLRNDRSRETYQ
jgi:hypothetical protein